MKMAITVDDLLSVPFSARTLEEKVRIVTDPRPRPDFGMWIALKSHENKIQVENNSDLYDKIKWIAGCYKRERFFCWTCLLFMPPGQWNDSGISDLWYVLKNEKLHVKSAKHIEAEFKLKVFVLENVPGTKVVLDKVQHNETVKLNSYILKLLIDTVCVAATTGVCSEEYECHLVKKENCVQFLRFTKNCGGQNADLTDAAVAMLKKSPKIINDLVDAITALLKVAIIKEIRGSHFVSVIVNEHVTSKKSSQISTVLRYVKQGKVCERFVGFTNAVDVKWSHVSLGNHISNIIQKYEISQNFLALSIDCVVLPKDELPLLFRSIRSRLERFYFIPCSGFGYILLQSMSIFDECSLFLRTIHDLQSFLSHEERSQALNEFLLKAVPNPESKKLSQTLNIIEFLGTFRKYTVDFLNLVIRHSESWPAEDIVKAEAFRNYLQQLHTVFLLKTFKRIFSDHFDQHFNFCSKQAGGGGVFRTEAVVAFLSNTKALKDKGFAAVWLDVTMDMVDEKATKSKKLEVLKNPIKNDYINLFQKITSHLIEEVSLRYEDLIKMNLCAMFNCNNLGVPKLKKSNVLKFIHEQSSLFDVHEIMSEMSILNGISNLISKKSIYEMLATFGSSNFKDIFTQLYKVLEFVLALPYLPATKENNNIKLKQIREYSFIPIVEDIVSGDSSILYLEAELVEELKRCKNFYRDVIAAVSEANKDLELLQK